MPDSNRLVVNYVPAEPENVLSGYPSITLTMAPDTSVIEAQIRGPTSSAPMSIKLMSTEQAWQLVSTGQAYLAPDLSEAGIDPGTEVKGRVTFTQSRSRMRLRDLRVVASTSSRSTSSKDGFGRRATKRTYPITAYVSALSNSGAPVG